MLKIALCDDNMVELHELSAQITEYLETMHSSLAFAIIPYNSSSQLAKDISQKKRADVYILDILMPQMNGLQLAGWIRQYDPNSPLFFVTEHIEYATEGYKVRALRYIQKSRSSEELREALELVINQYYRQNGSTIVIESDNAMIRIKYREILYVDFQDRRVVVHDYHSCIPIKEVGLADFFNRLNDERFVYSDRNCFINIDYLKRLEKETVTLANGDKLPVSRRRARDIKRLLIERGKEGGIG